MGHSCVGVYETQFNEMQLQEEWLCLQRCCLLHTVSYNTLFDNGHAFHVTAKESMLSSQQRAVSFLCVARWQSSQADVQ